MINRLERILFMKKDDLDIKDLLNTYPRKRDRLPEGYQKIYTQHYTENRTGKTKVSNLSRKMEYWLHKKVARSAGADKKTLEIGAGTLNQLDFERSDIYDIVEPYKKLYEDSPNLRFVRNIYSDISEIKGKKYDRVISVACFEHVENLPEMILHSIRLLKSDGELCVSIPNEGRFLWKFAYTVTTGREFKKRYGLKYETLMHYEHINTADEIEFLLKYYFKDVKQSLLGINKTFAFYRYYECKRPRIHQKNK